MATTMTAPRGQREGNTLAPALPLLGEARIQARASDGHEWLTRLVADSIDACMSRKEAAIRLTISEPTLSKQLSCEDGKCMRFDRFAELGDAVAIELSNRIRAHFGLDDPAERMQHAMKLVTQGMALLVAEAKR
jgi:hypothetical protein